MAIWTSTVPRKLSRSTNHADVCCSAQWPSLLERLIPRLDLVTVFESGWGKVCSLMEMHRSSTTCSQLHPSLFPSLLYYLSEMDDRIIFPVKIHRRKTHRKKTLSWRPHQPGNPLDYGTFPCPLLPSAHHWIQVLLDLQGLFLRSFSPYFPPCGRR